MTFSFNSLIALKSEILYTFFSLAYQDYFELCQKASFFYHLIFELTKLDMLIVMHADFKVAFKNSKMTLMERLLFRFEKVRSMPEEGKGTLCSCIPNITRQNKKS